MNKKERLTEKEMFSSALTNFVKGLGDYMGWYTLFRHVKGSL